MTNKNKSEKTLDLEEFILINKPKDLTSFDVIKQIKKNYPHKTKIGHTGTLDPFATGLLIICIGKATKQISKFMDLTKEYVVTAKLGELTDTLDHTGKIVEKQNVKNISKEDLLIAIKKLGHEYTQVPPIYSALKYKGKPLYKLARENILTKDQLEKIVQTKSRQVKIVKIELLNFESPFFSFKTTVSKGTYIRSLANDIAQQLNLSKETLSSETFNVNATTYELCRTKIGEFKLEDSIPMKFET